MARTPILALDPKEIAPAIAEIPRRDRTPDRARYEARALYVTHPDGVTLHELAESPRMRELGVTEETIREWCKTEGWVEERKRVLESFGEKLKGELQRALYSRITKVRVEQLNTVQMLKQDLVRKVLITDAKSAEAAAKVVVDLMKHELELSTNIAQELVPQGGAGQIEARNALTEDEVLHAARIVLAKRRQGLTVTIKPERRALPEGGHDGTETAPEGRASAEQVDQ